MDTVIVKAAKIQEEEKKASKAKNSGKTALSSSSQPTMLQLEAPKDGVADAMHTEKNDSILAEGKFDAPGVTDPAPEASTEIKPDQVEPALIPLSVNADSSAPEVEIAVLEPETQKQLPDETQSVEDQGMLAAPIDKDGKASASSSKYNLTGGSSMKGSENPATFDLVKMMFGG